MSTQLIQDIEAILQELLPEYKFRRVSQSLSEANFGNEIIEYSFEDFRARVLKDRGQLFIDLAPPKSLGAWHRLKHIFKAQQMTQKDAWYMLPLLLEYWGIADEREFLSHDLPCLRKQVHYLSQNLSKAKETFGRFHDRKASLDQFGELKGQERLQEIFGESERD